MGLFKEYDIRGIYGSELNEDFAYNLGKTIISYTKAKSVVIGYDPRNGNLKLFSAIAKAITESGINVTHAGLITRPMLNWIAWKHKFDLGIIITASHNPREYNGFKFVWHASPLNYTNGLNDVESLMEKNAEYKKSTKLVKNSKERNGKIVSHDYVDDYVDFLSLHLSKDFNKYAKKFNVKIVGDASNGAAGEIIKRFFKKNNIDSELLFSDPDGRFPCHNPNPLDNSSMIVLSQEIIKRSFDFGFIVDPDGDRIRFADDKGTIVENNYVDCLIIKYLLKQHKKASIVHDLISRKILSETITKNGGRSISSKVGTSNIIQNMISNHAIFGCEMSGHRYYGVMNNFDSGMMTLVQFINTLYCHSDHAEHDFSRLWKKFDKYIDLGELNYKFDNDSKKKMVLDNILKHCKRNKKKLKIKRINTIDGITAQATNYWFNIRPSNTEPLLRLRIEGRKEKILLKIKKDLEKQINNVAKNTLSRK